MSAERSHSVSHLTCRNENLKWVVTHGHNHPHGPEDFGYPESHHHHGEDH